MPTYLSCHPLHPLKSTPLAQLRSPQPISEPTNNKTKDSLTTLTDWLKHIKHISY